MRMKIGGLAAGLMMVLAAGIAPAAAEPHVAVMDMEMMILPGTQSFLENSIERAAREGAKVLVVRISTPGGMLTTSQKMIQDIFKSPVPVVLYVAPSGATATSAGVFITVAGHVAAMAPGTSIGAAHPVSGEGKDIEGDMRAKAENMTVAMVKAIADQRGRNVSWVEDSVKKSSSITEKEAVKQAVVDFIADDMDDLLRQLKGRKVRLENRETTLEDYSRLPRTVYEISLKDSTINVLANPNIAALLWLGATTGLSLELYNPGAILPGVVGVICLVLALAVSQIIPINQGGILLLVVGTGLIGLELFVPSGILGIGGVVAMVLGALYLVDVSQAPGMGVNPLLVVPAAAALGGLVLGVVVFAVRALRRKAATGFEGLVGQLGEAVEDFEKEGQVFVNGETWTASAAGPLKRGDKVEVTASGPGLRLQVRKAE